MKKHIQTFLTWQWVKAFLYWLVVSAGTVSECCFLIAGIWVSVNARVHPFVLQFATESQSRSVTYLADVAFTALPEIIMPLAIVITLGHVRAALVTKKRSPWVWATLFGLPTLLFIVLSAWTLAASSLSIGYEVPAFFSVASTIAAYVFSISALLYWKIGSKDYADYVNDLEAEYGAECTELSAEIDRLKSEIETINEAYSVERSELLDRLTNTNKQVNQLAERASSLALQGLENYPIEVIEWLNNGNRTCTLDELIAETGFSKRKIQSANLQVDPRNKNRYRKSSVADWLRRTPPPNRITEPMRIISISEYQEVEA